MEIQLPKIIVQFGIVICFSLSALAPLVESLPFPGIFPILTTGWYYKPGPTESIVLGLIVVKILALRLGATVAGVPYHLNDIFDSNILPFLKKRGKRSRHFGKTDARQRVSPLSSEEIEVLERILLALRRVDSHDCFIRYVCQVNQDHLDGKKISASDNTWLRVFKLRPVNQLNSKQPSVWNIYEEGFTSERRNCSMKYSQCPLTAEDLTKQSIISGLF